MAATSALQEDAGEESRTFKVLPITSHQTLDCIRGMPVHDQRVFIASYPKSGTTWMQNIVLNIVRAAKGATREDQAHISLYAPFLEADGSWDLVERVVNREVAEHQAQLGWELFNTHLLHSMLPGAGGKIIYVLRRPEDVCVSFWMHFSHMAPDDGGWTGDLATFVDAFLEGSLPYGKWTDHVRSWLAASRTDKRVLLVKYEDLKGDLPGCVERIAQHLGISLPSGALEVVLSRTSFQFMQEHLHLFEPISVKWLDKGDGFRFIRQGTVGSASDTLSEAQLTAIAGDTAAVRIMAAMPNSAAATTTAAAPRC